MTLRDTLAYMLKQAAMTGQPQRRNLARGLRLYVKIDNSQNQTLLGISRADTVPSLVEWQTVLRALPYAMKIKPRSGTSREGHYVLFAKWNTPTQETLSHEP